jgi:hypothetical protein
MREERMPEKLNTTHFAILFSVSCIFCGAVFIAAQEPEKELVEPIFRVPKIAKLPPSDEQTADGRAATVEQNHSAVDTDAAQNDPANQQSTQSTENSAADTRDPRLARNPAAVAGPDKKSQQIVPSDIAKSVAETSHPLDRAILMAHEGLQHMKSNIHDYTADLIKRERIDNRVCDPTHMKIKIRNARTIDNRSVPFSIYMKFVRPNDVTGREVIWVQGHNNDQLIAHEKPGSLKGMKRFHLDPDGWIAMQGNLHPIYEAGLENLVLKLIEKAERDRQAGLCEVNYSEGAKINKRPCMLVEVIHHNRVHPYEFYKAKVYIDSDLNIPVRYEAFDWPVGDQKPQLIEEYTYVNVKLNVGLTDMDFNPDNPAYRFPRF